MKRRLLSHLKYFRIIYIIKFATSRLDYCSGVLFRVPSKTTDRLQDVQNSGFLPIPSLGNTSPPPLNTDTGFQFQVPHYRQTPAPHLLFSSIKGAELAFGWLKETNLNSAGGIFSIQSERISPLCLLHSAEAREGCGLVPPEAGKWNYRKRQ